MLRRAVVGALAAATAVAGPIASPGVQPPGWTNLFDGRTLDGWKASEHPEAWSVKDGTLSCHGERSHLFYVGPVDRGNAILDNPQFARTFVDFEAEFEVRTRLGANSGVYFLTEWQDSGWPAKGFEMQVNNTQPVFAGDTGAAYRENKKTGSLYGIRNTYKALARDDEWFTLRLRVQVPRIQIHVNDVLVVDYVEPERDAAGIAGPLQRIAPGTFALQCHDEKSQVQYRRVAVRRLPPATAGAAARAPVPGPAEAKRDRLARDNFPLVDLRALDAPEPAQLDAALAAARAGGLFVGVTAGAGTGRPVKSDADLDAFVTRYGGKPLFLGLRAESAGWAALFTPKALARIDYVLFDDAMARARIPRASQLATDTDETVAQALVDVAVKALETEPIDVYGPRPSGAGAPHLSEALQQRLIDAAVRNKVAFEINGRWKAPTEAFVRKARDAGAKFTLGECAVDTPAGDYCFDVVETVGLPWRHMWVPGHEPPRAARGR